MSGLNRLNPAADLGTNGARGQLNETLDLMSAAIRRLQTESAAGERTYNSETGRFEPTSENSGATTFTPEGSWTGGCTYYGIWWRDGAYLCVQVVVRLAGAPTPAATQLVVRPFRAFPSLTEDRDFLLFNNTSEEFHVCGRADVHDVGTGWRPGVCGFVPSGVGYEAEIVPLAGTGATVALAITDTAPQVFASGDVVTMDARIPIKEWR